MKLEDWSSIISKARMEMRKRQWRNWRNYSKRDGQGTQLATHL